MNEIAEDIQTYAVKHLPIVKAYADKLGLVDIINKHVPTKMDTEPGILFLGMILDTLSGRTPLYRLEEFFEDQDTELILGKPVSLKSFNDTTVGRFIDQTFASGTIKIFTEIAKRAVTIFGVDCRYVHFDTTSKNVYGEYDLYKDEEHGLPFEITYGYSKDHRFDLKQFLISMLCVDRNIPIFGNTEDGNESDKNINNTILTDISRRMAAHGLEPGAFIYIADSAFVTESNLKTV